MPKFDGTGPRGMGPGTGRGFGPCGFRMGLGSSNRNRGLGRYCGYSEPQTKEEKAKALVDYKKALEEELEDVKKQEADLA